MKRVSKAEWLAVALDMLEEGGVDAVRVDRMARRLGISRSGFYWHFKDRQDLLVAILEYWTEEYTSVVIRSISSLGGNPERRLAKAMEMIEQHDLARYDLAIRGWARHDPLARTAVERVNTIRLDFIRSIFAEMGFEGDELEMRTTLFVCYQTWERAMFFDMSPRKLARIRSARLAFLTRA